MVTTPAQKLTQEATGTIAGTIFANELVPEEGVEPSRGVNPTGF
jgi:hypothetical protein